LKYYLGAQVDVSRLVEGGRGVDGFERYLLKKEMDSEESSVERSGPKKYTLEKLRDLSKAFDLEESAVTQESSRRNSMTQDGGSRTIASNPQGRRVIQEDQEDSDINEESQDGDGAGGKKA
jgi:hypothetical protein